MSTASLSSLSDQSHHSQRVQQLLHHLLDFSLMTQPTCLCDSCPAAAAGQVQAAGQ